MPHEVTLRGPGYTFRCYGVQEAKQLGLIDSYEQEGSHDPISVAFEAGEGALLADVVAKIPDAILIVAERRRITIYRPKEALKHENQSQNRISL